MNDLAKDDGQKESARDLLKQLQDRFPVFAMAKPLAIGIDSEILATLPDLNRKLLRAALRMHTGSTRYLKASERATQRFNLADEPVAELTAEHRDRASALLKERFKRKQDEGKARREAEAQAKREAEAQAQRAEKLEQLAARFARPGSR